MVAFAGPTCGQFFFCGLLASNLHPSADKPSHPSGVGSSSLYVVLPDKLNGSLQDRELLPAIFGQAWAKVQLRWVGSAVAL